MTQRLTSLNAWFKLIILAHCVLSVIACDDESPSGEGAGAVSGGVSVAGSATPGGAPLSGVEPPIAGVSVTGGSEPEGGVELCPSCEADCAPLECSCPVGGPTSFDACQEGCCQEATPELCERLCDELRPPAECQIGETRCLEGTPSAIQRCNPELQWEVQPCEIDTECQLDRCLPTSCAEGERECVDATRVALCTGGSWELAETCDGTCAGGECTTPACANAIRERSYLGCEYLAIELPNLVSRDPISAPPVAVVLTNPSASEPVYISLYNPEGQLSELRPQVLLPIPDNVAGHPDYVTPQTVRSEVRDASGEIVEEGVMQADQLQIPPGGIGTLLLPHTAWPLEGSLVSPKAFRVVSDAPVGAYQFAPYCCNYSFSNDASLLIPTSALTGNYRYLGAPGFLVDPLTNEELSATMAIVATRDQTTVRFSLPPRGLIQADTSGRLSVERGQYVASLNRQETLLLRTQPDPQGNLFNPLPASDLTNTLIEADEPVAVFSGHECTNYPQALGACDHLEEQLFPLESWGRQFNLIPAPERGSNAPFELVYWKILAAEPDTRVTLSASFQELNAGGAGSTGALECGQTLDPNDPSVIVISGEGYCELSTKAAFSISSDKPISVMGVLSGQESVQAGAGFGAHLGDPAAFLAAPVRQYRADYAFLTPNTYYSDFATISFNEGTQITLDGEAVDLSAAQSVTGGQTRYIHIPLSDGAHLIRGTAPIGITIFAFDDFVSYAFTGGLNLTKR